MEPMTILAATSKRSKPEIRYLTRQFICESVHSRTIIMTRSPHADPTSALFYNLFRSKKIVYIPRSRYPRPAQRSFQLTKIAH